MKWLDCIFWSFKYLGIKHLIFLHFSNNRQWLFPFCLGCLHTKPTSFVLENVHCFVVLKNDQISGKPVPKERYYSTHFLGKPDDFEKKIFFALDKQIKRTFGYHIPRARNNDTIHSG